MRIFILDDEPMVTDALGLALRDHGHEVFAAHRAHGVVEAIGRRAPDVVVADFNLPDRRGDDVAAEIRAQFPQILVVMTSGLSEREAGRALGAQGHAFLQKPFTPRTLLACIATAQAARAAAP